jgi:hypothetical protein
LPGLPKPVADSHAKDAPRRNHPLRTAGIAPAAGCGNIYKEKASGVRTAHQRKEAIQRLAEGAVQADLARSYGVSQATISRLAAPSPFGQAWPAREKEMKQALLRLG